MKSANFNIAFHIKQFFFALNIRNIREGKSKDGRKCMVFNIYFSEDL